MRAVVGHPPFAREDRAHDPDVLARTRERLANGTPYQPSTTCGPDTPRPSDEPPAGQVVEVSAAIAVAAGARRSCMIDVPSLIRSVCAPHQASGVSASDP